MLEIHDKTNFFATGLQVGELLSLVRLRERFHRLQFYDDTVFDKDTGYTVAYLEGNVFLLHSVCFRVIPWLR